jgi:hypothetical protein
MTKLKCADQHLGCFWFFFISKAAITFFCHTFLLGVVVHTYNPSTQKAEAGGS